MKTTAPSATLGFINNFRRRALSCLLLVAASACAPLSQAQVVMQDTFNYKISDIDGHAPTKGSGSWSVWAAKAQISADGKQAAITTTSGKVGEGEGAKASLVFTPKANTIYTLKITFKFAGPADKDCWFGMGFINPTGEEGDEPWLLIRPQGDPDNEGGMVALRGKNNVGDNRISASEYKSPITASIKWNTATGETQYFVNDRLQEGTGKTTTLPTSERAIYFQGFNIGNLLTVTNVTLTAEPVKGTQPTKAK